MNNATDKQKAFITSLLAARVVESERAARIVNAMPTISTRDASDIIGVLLSLPEKPREASAVRKPAVADGRYAIESADGVVKFYYVNTPTEGKWAGMTFVKVQASDDLWPVRDRAARESILKAIAVDAKAAMLRYGALIGRCGHCGRTLTDEASRARGIGPVCADKMGF